MTKEDEYRKNAASLLASRGAHNQDILAGRRKSTEHLVREMFNEDKPETENTAEAPSDLNGRRHSA